MGCVGAAITAVGPRNARPAGGGMSVCGGGNPALSAKKNGRPYLRLPGCGDDGPTLEIFQYDEMGAGGDSAANVPGLRHIAFLADDVEAMYQIF